MKIKNWLWGSLLAFFVIIVINSPVYGHSANSKLEIEIAKVHADSDRIDMFDGADIHFLWDQSYYIDMNGVRYDNVLVNHPAYLTWKFNAEENAIMSFESNKEITPADARILTDTLGASEKFYGTMIDKTYSRFSVPNMWINYEDMFLEKTFTYNPAEVKLAYRIEKNAFSSGKLKGEYTCYKPTVTGYYTISIFDSYNYEAKKEIAKMVLPVSCEINYSFKRATSLADKDNAGYNYVWNGMVINTENKSGFGMDYEWILGDYYKLDEMISTDIELEVGEKYQLALADCDINKGVYDSYGPKAYYRADENGIYECAREDMPYDFGYHPECAKITKSGLVTAKKEGTFRVDVYYPKKGRYLSFKITVRNCAKPVDFVSVKKVGRNGLKLKWKKCKTADGYQIQYSTSKSFKNAKTITIDSAKKTSTTLKNLTSNKYYIRIRSYKTKFVFKRYDPKDGASYAEEKTYYSKWTKYLH